MPSVGMPASRRTQGGLYVCQWGERRRVEWRASTQGVCVIRRSWLRLICVLLIGVLIAAGCGSSRKSNSSGTTTTAASASASGKFGDLASPCGKGSAKGSTEKGVTDTSITIGFGDDHGFSASPGLNHEQSDAMQ